jgi:hypothetical protein
MLNLFPSGQIPKVLAKGIEVYEIPHFFIPSMVNYLKEAK